jgi:hypothetical protein
MNSKSQHCGAVSFREKPGQSTAVLVGGAVVGHIYRKPDGFVYAPKGSTLRGKTFPTLAQVKQSLVESEAA